MKNTFYLFTFYLLFISCSHNIDIKSYEGNYIDVSSSKKDTVHFTFLNDNKLLFVNSLNQRFIFLYDDNDNSIESEFIEGAPYRLGLSDDLKKLILLNENIVIGVRLDFYDEYLIEFENSLLNEVEQE